MSPLRSAVLVLLGLISAAGCNRKPQFVPPPADSSAVAAVDSAAVLVQQARSLWEMADGGTDAAPLTARLVIEDLRLHPDEPVDRRARTFADSAGFGAEAAGQSDIVALNFFAPSNPAGGSWPYLFWRDEGGEHLQAVEGSGLRLLALALNENVTPAEGPAPGKPATLAGTSQVALLFARAAGGGQQPLVFVWNRPRGAAIWTLLQSLGPDSLGGIGTAQFVVPPRDSIWLTTRTFRPTARFEECPTCPHVYRVRAFRWTALGLRSAGEEVERSSYYVFVQFLNALALGDRDLAASFVTDPSLIDAALGYDWGQPKGNWRLAPGTEASPSEMVFFRGRAEAYRLHFARRGADFLISGFEPTSRTIE